MNPTVKTQWLEALRSGSYQQGTGVLRDAENSFCCLGVLCDLYVKEHPERSWEARLDALDFEDDIELTTTYALDCETDLLPERVKLWAELEDDNPAVKDGSVLTRLTVLNDEAGRSFPALADLIEAQL